MSTSTPWSSDKDILTLDLEGNEDEYERFIQSIINMRLYKFEARKPVQKEARLEVFERLVEHLKTSPLARTPFIKELIDHGVETWYFIVKLKHRDVELDILIRRVDLYLAGYKKDEKWILLQGETYFQKNQVVKWFKDVRKERVEITQTKLGDSYYHLFSECRPGFKAGIHDEVEAALKAGFIKKIEEQVLKMAVNIKKKRSFEKNLQDASINQNVTQGKIDEKNADISALEKKLISLLMVKEKLLKYESIARMLTELETEMKANIDNKPDLCLELTKQQQLVESENAKLSQDIKLKRVKEETQKLKLNREALIDAVKYLRFEPFNNQGSAEHILTLIHMICEAVRFRKVSDHIKENYFSSVTTLTEEITHLIHKWTKGSHVITSLGKDPPSILLGVKKSTLFDFLPHFSCIKGTRVVLRWKRPAGTSTSANGGMEDSEFERCLE